MAEKLLIQRKGNTTKIFLDDEQVRGVTSYELKGDCNGVKIKLEVFVRGEVEVQL